MTAVSKQKSAKVVGKEKFDENLLVQARENFRLLQRTWYDFAKTIFNIHASKAYEGAGYASFMDYCEQEFPSVDYNTMIKFVSIVGNLGDIFDSRLKKEPSYIPPAYESCYLIATAEKKDNVDKVTFSRLKKQLFDNKLSYKSLREALKECAKEERLKEMEDKSEEVEAELTKEVDDVIDAEIEEIEDIEDEVEDIDDEESDSEDEDDIVEELSDKPKKKPEVDFSDATDAAKFLMKFMRKHIETLHEDVKGFEKFATLIDELADVCDGYLEHAGKIIK